VKIRKIIATLCALPLLAIGLPATAQTDLTCDDITFGYEMTSRFPRVGDACLAVVEVDGERFAKMSVEIVRTGAGVPILMAGITAYENSASGRSSTSMCLPIVGKLM